MPSKTIVGIRHTRTFVKQLSPDFREWEWELRRRGACQLAGSEVNSSWTNGGRAKAKRQVEQETGSRVKKILFGSTRKSAITRHYESFV
jgi:hypothetical protein